MRSISLDSKETYVGSQSAGKYYVSVCSRIIASYYFSGIITHWLVGILNYGPNLECLLYGHFLHHQRK